MKKRFSEEQSIGILRQHEGQGQAKWRKRAQTSISAELP